MQRSVVASRLVRRSHRSARRRPSRAANSSCAGVRAAVSATSKDRGTDGVRGGSGLHPTLHPWDSRAGGSAGIRPGPDKRALSLSCIVGPVLPRI